MVKSGNWFIFMYPFQKVPKNKKVFLFQKVINKIMQRRWRPPCAFEQVLDLW